MAILSTVLSLIIPHIPTIWGALMTKGTWREKALTALRGFVKDPNATIDDIKAQLEHKKLDVYQIIELKKLEYEFRKLAADHAQELERKGLELVDKQIELIKSDLRSKSKLRRYWRPAVAWILTAGLGLFVGIQVILVPVLALLSFAGVDTNTIMQVIEQLKNVSADFIIALIVPLLGLGAYRSYEKRHGVADLPPPFAE